MKISITVLASILHVLPHPFGVSPVGGFAVYSGAFGETGRSRFAALIPLAAGLLVTGIYNLTVLAFVAAGMLAATLVARVLLRRRSLARYPIAVFGAASAFYLLSNFAVWLVGYYPPTTAGLVACYIAGLPLLGVALLADAAYAGLFHLLHVAIDRRPGVEAAA